MNAIVLSCRSCSDTATADGSPPAKPRSVTCAARAGPARLSSAIRDRLPIRHRVQTTHASASSRRFSGLVPEASRSSEKTQGGDHKAGTSEHDSDHPLHESEFKRGKVALRRQRVDINTGGNVLGSATHGSRDGISMIRVNTRRGQITGDFVSVKHVINLPRRPAYQGRSRPGTQASRPNDGPRGVCCDGRDSGGPVATRSATGSATGSSEGCRTSGATLWASDGRESIRLRVPRELDAELRFHVDQQVWERLSDAITLLGDRAADPRRIPAAAHSLRSAAAMSRRAARRAGTSLTRPPAASSPIRPPASVAASWGAIP